MSPSAQKHPHQEEEDDGSWVNAELLAEILEDEAVVLSVDVKRATNKGDNYLSVLFRTRLAYRKKESQEMQVKSIIVKGLPSSQLLQNYIEDVGLFKREISIYDDMLPRLYAFADSKIGNGSFKMFSPASQKTSRPDTLILDDLKAEGFIMASRRDRLDLAHSKLVVQNLARLHALSIACNEENPGTIAKYPETVFTETNKAQMNQTILGQMKSVLREMRKWTGVSYKSLINKCEARLETYLDDMMEDCSPNKCLRTALTHGDCWVNNILFRYSETRQPVDLRFVDFQMSREASPGLDLNYFLSTSPQTDVRLRHFDHLLQEYCDEFERCATELGYSGASFTFEEIHKEVKRTALYGFMAAVSVLPVVLAVDAVDVDTEESGETQDVGFFNRTVASEPFREAFESMLPYFEECGVFD